MDMDFLFDLDGTLVDRSRSVLEFVPRQFARFSDSSKNDGEEFARRFLELDANGYGDKGLLYQTLCAEFQLSAGAEELLQDFRARCFEAVHLYAGVRRFLDELRGRGIRMAVVSNGSSLSQTTKIEATGIAEYFDSILISGNLGFAKPDPRIFSLAADSLGVSSRECIFVGDNPERDIVGAGRSGMRTVWISHGIRWPERLGPAPAAILQSPSDLLGTVDALCARNEM